MPVAQINIARMLAPLEDEIMTEFREFLDPVNALAESSPGFVWRYTEDYERGETAPATPWSYDGQIVINMSVWESVDDLKNFVFKTVHSYFLRSRKRWFSQLDHPHTVLWYVPAGHVPSLEEAHAKLALLEERGPSAAAFLFAQAEVYGEASLNGVASGE